MAARCPRPRRRSIELPGVGRKTANVVLGHALGVPGLPVDRHVLRVANRLGLVHMPTNPRPSKPQLCAVLPPKRWTRASDILILHGRRICRPRPLCDRCQVRSLCAYYRTLGAKAARRADPAPMTRAAFLALVDEALIAIPTEFRDAI